MVKLCNVLSVTGSAKSMKTLKAISNTVVHNPVVSKAPKASAAEAMEVQGRAMLKKYVKPKINVLTIQPEALIAGSERRKGETIVCDL